MTRLSWIVVLGCLGLMACGGGDEREIVRLAAGYRVVRTESGDSELRAIILRNAGQGWVAVGGDALGQGTLQDVVFASNDVAWAHSGDALVRSRDGGRTWEDMSSRLPQALREGHYGFRGLAFASATTGYLVANERVPGGNPIFGPYVWITRDGGDTWTAGDDLAPRLGAGSAVAVRAGGAEIVRHSLPADAPGAVVQGFDGNDHPIETLTSLPTIIREGLDAVGERAWIALTVLAADAPTYSRLLILTSERRGAPWVAQPVPDTAAGDFGTLDMCDERVGLAGGNVLIPFRPVAFWTEDGGESWHDSTMPTLDAQFITSDVACVSRDEMLMLAVGGGETGRTVLLRSEDGGRSFGPVDMGLDGPVWLDGIASNAALR